MQRGQDLAQVHRDRLQPGDHLVAHQVGLHVHPVDLGLVHQHLGDEAQVLVEDGVHRPAELALDQPRHRGGYAAQPVEVGVELAVGVVRLLVHVGPPAAQPKRPVM